MSETTKHLDPLSVVSLICQAVFDEHKLDDMQRLRVSEKLALRVMMSTPGKTAKPQYDKVHFSR